MKLSEINSRTLVDYLASLNRYLPKKFRTVEDIRRFLPLLNARVGFYGRRINEDIFHLSTKETVFDSKEDVIIIVEGYVELTSKPINS